VVKGGRQGQGTVSDETRGVYHQASDLRWFRTDVRGDPEDVTLLSVDNWGVCERGLEPCLAAQNKAGESTDVKVMGPLLLQGRDGYANGQIACITGQVRGSCCEAAVCAFTTQLHV